MLLVQQLLFRIRNSAVLMFLNNPARYLFIILSSIFDNHPVPAK